MNCPRLAIALLFAGCVQAAYADSIPVFHITEATMSMRQNDGSGDNISFTFSGPGVMITGIAGMGCYAWCSGFPISEPSGSPSQVFLSGSYQTAVIGGVSYEPTFLFLDIFSSDGGLNGSTIGTVGDGDNFLQFRMTAPTNGSWNLIFNKVDAQGGNPAYYYFAGGSFEASATLAPEPGTIGLVLTGLAGMAGLARRKIQVHH
jgi:hypothetical protein